MEKIIYKIEEFEGPLDLLLSLISKNEMKIEDIQISVICEQYMDYIAHMQERNIELSSEFIVMASELMLIKSKMLLPRFSPDEPDPRADLARALLEYQRAKQASEKLSTLYDLYNGRMVKETDEITADRSYVCEHDINLLTQALKQVIGNMPISDEQASENIIPLISHRTISVTEKVYAILRKLLQNNGRINVISCFDGVSTMHELVAVFMAILEMLHDGRIVIQEDTEKYESKGFYDLADSIYIDLYRGKIKKTTEESY